MTRLQSDGGKGAKAERSAGQEEGNEEVDEVQKRSWCALDVPLLCLLGGTSGKQILELR